MPSLPWQKSENEKRRYFYAGSQTPEEALIYYYVIVMTIVLLFNLLAMPYISALQVKEVSYGTFMSMTEEGSIGQVDVQDNQIVFTDKENSQVYKTGRMEDPNLNERLYAAGITDFGSEIVEETSPLLSFLLTWILPIAVFIFFGQMMSRKMMDKMGGGASSMSFNMGKSNAKAYVKSDHGISFANVEGVDEAEESLQEIVDYLHDPSKYKEIGATMPKGVLLVGPPGTGKTMLAKAVAGEADVPFFSISGSEFVEMFVGMGASKVRDLFKQAKEKAPCIVFIDEIDAIGQKRNAGSGMGGNDEREQTLNQLLTEMDGFEGNSGVMILAATNRPKSLDPALTRPGRFDRRVPVELPDLDGREKILRVHAKKVKIADDVDFNKVARMASGASGAELANIVSEAALRAVRSGRKFATQADLEESIEVVIAGYQKKNAIMSDKEKMAVAYTTEQCAVYYEEILEFSDSTFEDNLVTLGCLELDAPASISLYAATFESKDVIEEAIECYNEGVEEIKQIQYTDYVGIMMSSVTSIINAVTYVLIAFVAISLVVSSIMIGVITLISVQERTKEIGILRAIGASKKNVSSMFTAETAIIGFTSGAIGVGVTWLLCFPINAVIQHLTGIPNLKAYLPWQTALVLVGISILLTLFSGIIPSRSAAKKDPVVALRTE